VVGPPLAMLKRGLRRLLAPVLGRQVEHNEATMKVAEHLMGEIAAIVERQEALRELLATQGQSQRALAQTLAAETHEIDRLKALLAAELQAVRRQAEELREHLSGVDLRQTRSVGLVRERMSRTERKLRRLLEASGQRVDESAAPPDDASAAPEFDYFGLEERFRGSEEAIKTNQRIYLDLVDGHAPILDVGCGRGEFLVLLRDAGVDARGIDADADMAAFARGEGVDVEQADAIAYLDGLEDGSLGGVFAAQVVEHLPPQTLIRLLELAAAKLRPRGLLVAETINPLSPLALRSYFADLTHAQPLVPDTLVLLAQHAGFREIETRYLNEPDERLAVPDDPLIAANVQRLNELLFGPLDYAIVART
jgi:O-antigen chain-terminating methyltransferase